jgi:hypothetical protein
MLIQPKFRHDAQYTPTAQPQSIQNDPKERSGAPGTDDADSDMASGSTT